MTTADPTQRTAGRVLSAGTLTGVSLAAAGWLLGVASITLAGLLVLAVTPAIQLAIAAVAFARTGERQAAVLAVVAVAVLGLAVGLAIVAASGG